MAESSVNIKVTMGVDQALKSMSSIRKAMTGFSREERAMHLSRQRAYEKMFRDIDAHSARITRLGRIEAKARREYTAGREAEARAMVLSQRREYDIRTKAHIQFYAELGRIHERALRENERRDKAAAATAVRTERQKMAGIQRSGAVSQTIGRGAGQVMAGFRGGLSNMWVTGAGFSQLATGIGMAVPKLAGLMGVVGAAANVLSNFGSLVITVGLNLAKMAASAARAAISFGVGLVKSVASATVAVARFAGNVVIRGLQTMWGVLKGILGTVASITVKMGLLATAATAASAWLAKSWADTASKFEGFMAKMEVAFKSRGAAAAWMDWSKRKAMTTPFDTEEVVDSISRLAMYGAQKFGTLTEWFQLTGDMAGAMSRSVSDAVEAIVDVIYGGGMERIKEFGINSFELLQHGAIKAPMGTGVARGSAKEIDALVKALKSVMVEKFGGGMEKLRKTLRGLASDLKDIWVLVKAALGNALAPALRVLIPYVSSLGKAFLAWIEPLASNAAPKIEAFAAKMVEWTEAMRAKVAEKWKEIAPKVAQYIGEMVKRVKAWIEGQGGWAGIWQRIKDGAVRIWNALKSLVAWVREVAPKVIGAFRNIFARISAWLESKGGLSGIWQRIREFGLTVWNAIKTMLVPAFQYLAGMVGWAYGKLTGGMKLLQNLGGGVTGAIQLLSRVLVWIANQIPTVVMWIEYMKIKWQEWAAALAPVIEYVRANFVPTLDMLWQGVKGFAEQLGIAFGEGSGNRILDFVTWVTETLQKFAAILPTIGAAIKAFLVDPFLMVANALKAIVYTIKTMFDMLAAGPRVLNALLQGKGIGDAFGTEWNRLKGDYTGNLEGVKGVFGGIGQTASDYQSVSDAYKDYKSGATEQEMEFMARGNAEVRRGRNNRRLSEAQNSVRVQIIPPQGWQANPKVMAF